MEIEMEGKLTDERQGIVMIIMIMKKAMITTPTHGETWDIPIPGMSFRCSKIQTTAPFTLHHWG